MSYDHRPIPMNIASKVLKCVCKIKSGRENRGFGTGFFLKVSENAKFLVCSIPFWNEKLITIEIWNRKIMNLAFNGRFFKKAEIPNHTTIIEIKETDDIYSDIDFLDYEPNYQKGYNIYNNSDIFSIHFPLGGEAACASGKVIEIDKDQFYHNIPTDKGSGGCPILLLSEDINFIKVIGVHWGKDCNKMVGIADFIGRAINEINKSFKSENKCKVFDKNKIFYNNGINNININIDNNIDDMNNININKIFNPNNSNVYNQINYNNKILPFNNNLNNIKGNFIQQLNNNSNRTTLNKNPLSSSNISNNSIKSQKEKVLFLTNNPKEAITLHFKSSNQLINYAIHCKTEHKFNMIANQIFEREPNFVENGLLFLCGGRKINEYKTIKDNQLKNGDVIIIQTIE